MVTCPLCRTRFPYRASARASSASTTAVDDDNPFGGGEPSAAPKQPTNRLVNPRYVPKSNKTQTIMMIVGFAAVSITVLVILLSSLKNNPFGSNREASETFTSDEYNYKFRKFDPKAWQDDKKLQTRMKISGFTWRRSSPDAWFGLHAKDYVKADPPPNEMRTQMMEMIRRGLTTVDSTEPIKQTIGGKEAEGVRFQGEYDNSPVTGEAFAFHNKGIGYVIIYLATNDGWDTAKPELDEFAKSFEFATARDKWQEKQDAYEKHFLESGNFQMDDRDGSWQRGIVPDEGVTPKKKDYVILDLKDKDPKAVMAFRLKTTKGLTTMPEVVVVVLDQADDPVEAARTYWLKKKQADETTAKLALDEIEKYDTPIPPSAATIKVFNLTNNEDSKSKMFYAISALNIDGKLVAAIGWCREKESEKVEGKLLNLLATLRERK